MGTCIICGATVDGVVCQSHEEDVCFIFEGKTADQLSPGRYYQGTVDGFADFGIFIDIGEVTGLLHTSELDRRLESIDWEPGDTVYVQVKNVRENGNVDLGWSIRQHESEFRGVVRDTPEGDRHVDEDSSGPAESESPARDEGTEPSEPAVVTEEREQRESRLERTAIGSLEDYIGAPVRIEGKVVDVRQTSGPTIFEVQDETGTVACAAFESAGVRAYPEVDANDIVRVDGEVEERRGAVQVETVNFTPLSGADREAVERRLDAAIAERSAPPEVSFLGEHPGVDAAHDAIVEAATMIRRAVFETRPVIVRHNATTDGYAAGAAIERAVLSLIRAEHEEADAEYHYFDRRPLDGRIYDMEDAMRDTTSMLNAQARHDEAIPLFVFVNAASTSESRASLELLAAYDAPTVVIDGDHPDGELEEHVAAFVSPYPDEAADTVSTTALGVNVAGTVNPDVRDDLRHLPAVSYRRDPPETYVELAQTAGFDQRDTRTIHQALALEAFYQAFEDKRELIADVLFDSLEFAERASEQFNERLDREVRTAEPHLDRRSAVGAEIAVLDMEAYTHQYDFPPAPVLLSELADRANLNAVIGAAQDELVVHNTDLVDMRSVGRAVADAIPDGGVETRGGRDGSIVFLSGVRDAVIDAAVEAVAAEFE